MSKKHTFIYTGLSLCVAGGMAQTQSKQPNIVFIFADDMGYSDLACYGSKVNRTPNLDQLAKDGIRFTDFYSASPHSSPSRAALLTGRYPVRMGINNVFFPESYTGIPETEITLPEVLQKQGYYTGIVGKWHLGHHRQFLPLQHGFNEYFGIPYSNDMTSVVYMRGNEVEKFRVNQDSITFTYTQEACRFLERNKNRPFFLYLPHTMPHVPLAASANFKGKSANGLYGDVIEELDWSTGEVLKKLKELGLDNNTIVVFSSDNGPWLTEGPMGGSALPLFQGKNTTWEGGQRVPTIIRWKNRIAKGQVNNEVASMIDWFPTFLRLTGGKIPTDRMIDGKDISPVLFGAGKRENHDFAFIHYGNLEGFRSEEWKIKFPEPLRKGNFWVADVPAHDTILFNLKTDIAETTDVKEQYPEVYRKIVGKANAFKETLKDCPPSLIVGDGSSVNLVRNQREKAIKEAKKEDK